jgi:prophage regulatory protein
MRIDTNDLTGETRLLRISDVAKLTTLSKSCIHLWVAQGRFPAPITLSPTLKVWRFKHLIEWIESQTPDSDSNTSNTHSKSLRIAA